MRVNSAHSHTLCPPEMRATRVRTPSWPTDTNIMEATPRGRCTCSETRRPQGPATRSNPRREMSGGSGGSRRKRRHIGSRHSKFGSIDQTANHVLESAVQIRSKYPRRLAQQRWSLKTNPQEAAVFSNELFNAGAPPCMAEQRVAGVDTSCRVAPRTLDAPNTKEGVRDTHCPLRS